VGAPERLVVACLLSPTAPAERLADAARAFSPRVECRSGFVLVDVSGLDRIVGKPPVVARELLREARTRGIDAVVAVAPTRTAATLCARCLVPGAERSIVIPPGREREAVGELPLSVLSVFGFAEELPTLEKWGLRTLGELAALPPADLHARFGAAGLALHRAACGRDDRPLVPYVDPVRFEASIDLEWPIDGLEPLSFVLARLLDPLSDALEQADRGASAIILTLTLTTRERRSRRLELPAPMRDARTLRTLLLLHLESHPLTGAGEEASGVSGGIDRVAIDIEPTPARIVQYSLLERALPSPETLSTLIARLEAVMGTGRVGAPALVDSHEPGAFTISRFGDLVISRSSNHQIPKSQDHQMIIRRFRMPVPARVDLERGCPVRVTTLRRGLAGGRVLERAGPWRSSGGWWAPPRIATDTEQPRIHADKNGFDIASDLKTGVTNTAASVSEPWQAAGNAGRKWNIDAWEVSLPDGVYRIVRDRDTNRWFLAGILD
jgi:protein ImuB